MTPGTTLGRGASSISEPFIRRPIGTSLLAAAIIMLGVGAYTQLPVAPLPRVDLPTISVNASLPGASPETMSSAVATPLERRLGRIAGLTDMTSTSSLGSTSITLQFDLDRDQDTAGRDVQAAINAASADLPTNLPFRPNYRKVNPTDTPIMILALTSATLPLPQVFDAADTVLAQRIAQVEGVGQVYVGGGQQPAVRIQVDPEAAAGVNLTLADVRNVLTGASVNRPVGGVGNALEATTLATNDQLFRADAIPGSPAGPDAERGGAAGGRGQGRGRRQQQPGRGVDQRRALGADHRPAPARGEHHRDGRAHQGHPPLAGRFGLPGDRHPDRLRSDPDDPRLGP